MNEELQSVNDELHVTNEQLAERTGELDALNHFLESILSSLSPGVMVVGRDWRVQAWNRRAEDLWGVRSAEATGEHLLNLDIGLPVEALRPLVREVFDREPGAHEEPRTADFEAVNRRGRALTVRVTVRALDGSLAGPPGAIIVMEPVEG